jgi:hypothetical protein
MVSVENLSGTVIAAVLVYVPKAVTMDQISIKTPNPICRLYWCLMEFIL